MNVQTIRHLTYTAIVTIAILASTQTYAANKGGVDEAEGAYGVVFPIEAALPNPSMTPGAMNPAVSQDNIHETICVKGYTKTIRPPVSYTNRLKRAGIDNYGYQDKRLRDYEEDHLIPLEIGGSPTKIENLWPQPHHVTGGWGSTAKEKLEHRLHALVCREKISLEEAQKAIATNWIDAYKKYVGPTPPLR